MTRYHKCNCVHSGLINNGTSFVEYIDDLCHRIPRHAWRIRRLSLRDPRFRSICDDYGEALNAIEFWRHGKDAAKDKMVAKERVVEFCRIAEDLRQEVLEYLDTSDKC